jgi:hypothetical protein
MLIQKTDPVGIDIPVQLFQSYIHSALLTKWNITDEYLSYARASRNKTDDGYIAEVLEAGNSYKEVYWDARQHAVSFFGTSARTLNDNGTLQTDVHLVFFVDVKKIKPAITHRADEEIRKDVINACGSGMFGFEFEGFETGLENVLREYPGSRRDDRLKFVDMQPGHCFRLNFSITYDINNCS